MRKSGATAAARSSSSVIASYWPSAAAGGGRCGSGNDSGGTTTTCSPPMPSVSRLVASTRRPGAAPSSRSTSPAHASTTCSQLSSTSRSSRSARWSASCSSAGRADWSGTPSAVATACATWPPVLTGARSANQAPPANPRRDSRATSMASRVLPSPPAPVNVTSRDRASRRRTSASSRRRPTKLVRGVGRVSADRVGRRWSMGSGSYARMRTYGACPRLYDKTPGSHVASCGNAIMMASRRISMATYGAMPRKMSARSSSGTTDFIV